jgi:hypothetical protein
VTSEAKTSETAASDPFARAIAEIPSCALDEAGLQEQRARYVRLAPSVARLNREDAALEVEFAEGFDKRTLEETIAVERECCPFFEFEFDEAERRLRITVREAEQAPALDALALSLGAAREAHQA